jgi:hypothetical protein
MLHLAVFPIVMMACDLSVMVALTFVSDRRSFAGIMLGQRLHRVSKPRVVRDPTAKQHRGSSDCLQRQREQNDRGGEPDERLLHISRISRAFGQSASSTTGCVAAKAVAGDVQHDER